ncbi:MAG: DUF2339 domain-containing protein [Chloroflexota bacterium]
MKAVVVGIVSGLFVAASVPYGWGAGLVVGALAWYLTSRADDQERRIRQLEAGPAPAAPKAEAAQAALPADAVPIALPPPPPPHVPYLPGAAMPATAWNAAKPGARAASVSSPATVKAATPAAPRTSLADLETLFAGRLLAVVGGLALLIGVVFFLGLAFSRGWIGPELRVALGLVVGTAMFAVGAWFLLKPTNRTREILALVLVAVGLAVVSLGLFAASRLYALVAPEVAVGGALLAASLAAAVAIRARSQLVAGFGLVAVLAAPPIMGAGATLLTIVFLGAAMIGTTAICMYMPWRWLPTVAFLLSFPQLGLYVSDYPNLAVGLAAVVVYWGLNILSAAGEEVRRPSQQLSPTSATLLVATAAFTTWAGFQLLSGAAEPWRGLFLLGEAAAHLTLGSFFLARNGERHPFGMLVFGSGVAALTLAVPVQLGANWVPMAWAAEAVALAWVYARREHGYAGAVAVVLGALALGHLLFVEYAVTAFANPSPSGIPFANPDGLALAFVTLAAAAAIAFLHRRGEQVGVAAAMVFVYALVLPHELSGIPLVAGYGPLTAAAVLAERRWAQVPMRVDLRSLAGPWATTMAIGERALYASGALAAFLGLRFAIVEYLPTWIFSRELGAFAWTLEEQPFWDERTVVVAIVAATALVIGFSAGDRVYRWVGCVAAAVAIAYLMPFEVTAAWSVVAWLALALVLHVLGNRWQPDWVVRPFASYAFALAAAIETLAVVAPPYRLVVQAVKATEPAILNGGILAVAALTAAFLARAFLPPRNLDARIAQILAGAAGVYLLSIGTVDLFQANLGGAIGLDELRKQAQVALSVLWAVLGVAGFVIGLFRQSTNARLFGLGLLALVTGKVFIVDLAALDVAYRVLSFLALGLLLLGAAYLASRFQPDRPVRSGQKPPG